MTDKRCEIEASEYEIASVRDNLEDFFKTNYEQLCIHAYKLVKDHDEAQDIVQSLFTRLLDEKSDVKIETLRAYCYKAIYNSAINHLSHSERNRTEVINYVIHMQETLDLMDGEPYVYKTQVREAIEKIPTKSKDLLLLHCVHDMKYSEIAKLRGISINTVKSQMKVAYRILEEELQTLFKEQ